MDYKRWTRIQILFKLVLQKPENERESFLKDQCKDDDSLFDEITSLLNADNNVHNLLNGLAIDSFPEIVTTAGKN